MSFQVQPQPQQQQPVDVYPNPVTKQPTSSSSSSSHSGGSFGTVFIVLAVILVISAIACCLGRFCSKRRNSSSGHQKPSKPNKHNKPSKNSLKLHDGPPSFGPKDRVNDIELGFEKGFPTGGGGGGGRPAGPAGNHNGIGDGGRGRQNKIFGNGHIINGHAKVEPSHVSFEPQLRSGGR